MTETRYVYLKLPIVVEDNKFCAKVCPHLRIPGTGSPCDFTHCDLDRVRPLNYYGDEILRSDECFWAEDENDGFAREIDPDCSVIVLKKE